MRGLKPVSQERLEGFAKGSPESDEWMTEVQGAEAMWMAQEILRLRAETKCTFVSYCDVCNEDHLKCKVYACGHGSSDLGY